MSYKFEKKIILGANILSAGLLGNYGDIIVDNLRNTNFVYGISNGKGDFIRKLNNKQKNFLEKLRLKLVKN